MTGTQMRMPEKSDSNTVNKILMNALEHFSRFGYAGASVREITHASEVTKPTLYYYFKNKEELYKKLADSCFQEVWQTIEEASKISGTVAERTINILRQYCKLCEEKYTVVRFVHLMLMAAERQSPDVGVQELADRIRGTFAKIVQDGISSGEVDPQHAESATYAMVAIFNLRVESLVNKFQKIVDIAIVEEAITRVLCPPSKK